MNFLKAIFKNKKLLIFLLLFSLLPLLALAEDVNSLTGFLGGLASVSGLALDMAQGIIAAGLALVAGISILFMNLALSLLNWAASGDFVQSGMTSSMENPMISEGWTAVRNIANILLIFGLVAVAISIMLEYEENKAKRMLVDFVLMALLINFTPVICDTLIDVANILMSVFLKGGVSSNFSTALTNLQKAHKPEDILTIIVLAGFAAIAGFIYILYSILFMFRYVQLWILIIISPIAFASKVFVPTRFSDFMNNILPAQCQWKAWWDDFLKWTFIGVPAAFSIWLSNILMKAVGENATAITSAPTGALEGSLSLLFSYLIPLAVLIQGFVMTMNKGSSEIFNMGGALKGIAKRQTIGRARNFYDKTVKKQISGAVDRGKDAIKGTFSGGYEGLKDSSNAYQGKRDEITAVGGRFARTRGVMSATKGVLGGATKGGLNKLQDISIDKESKKVQEKEAAEQKEYASLKNLDDAYIDKIVNQKNATTDEAANKYSAAMRIKLERGGELNPADQDFIRRNQQRLTSDMKIAVAKKDSDFGIELLNKNDVKSSNAILTQLATDGKAAKARDWISNNSTVINNNTKKALKDSDARLSTVLEPSKSKIFNPHDPTARNHGEIISEEASGKNQSNMATLTCPSISAKKHTGANAEKQLRKKYKNLTPSERKMFAEEVQNFRTAHSEVSRLSLIAHRTAEQENELRRNQAVVEEYEGTNEINRLNAIIAPGSGATPEEVRDARQIKADMEAARTVRSEYITINRI